MSDWNLQLTEDTLRRRFPLFPTLTERIAAYEDYYFPFISALHIKTPASESRLETLPHKESASAADSCKEHASDLDSRKESASAPDSHKEPASDLDSRKESASDPDSHSGAASALDLYPPHSFPESAALDIRQVQSPFSTLLCLYDTAGNEYTFSRASMRHVKRALPWQGHYHTHDYIEILFCFKGSFQQILLGERHTFSAGEFVITDKNLEHADVLDGAVDTAVLFLSLRSDYLDQLLSSQSSQDDLQRFFFHALQKQRKEQSCLHLLPGGKPSLSPDSNPAADADAALGLQLSRLLETLVEEDYFPGPGSEEIIRGSLTKLLSLLCRHYSVRLHSSDQESKEQALLYELERYLRLHSATVTAAELEKTFHYHRNFYNLLLRKYRGTTFREYLQDIRMKHAAGLLKNTRLAVKEIALAAGYHNSSHFYHLFERHYGMSPTQYREL